MFRPTSIAKANFENSVRLDGPGEGRQDLPEPFGRDCAGPREQLRHRDCPLRPGHCGYRHSARRKTGAAPLGAPTGLITSTLGGSSSTLTSGGGPGGTTGGAGGAGSGVHGLTLDHRRRGAVAGEPGAFGLVNHPIRSRQSAAVEQFLYRRQRAQPTTYNFAYNQGFVTGTQCNLAGTTPRPLRRTR